MAEPRKTAVGTWRVEVEARGQRDSKTLPTKREALQWRDRRTAELLAVATGRAGTVKTLGDALRRYADEVSPLHRGERNEVVRLAAFAKPAHALPVKKKLADLTRADMQDWRDARLRVTARGSVLRDMGLLNAVLEHCRTEWQWLDTNPLKDVTRPANPDHREVLITPLQTRQVLRALGYRGRGQPVRTVSQAVAVCFLAALASGMRAGELCGLTWAHVYADYCRLPVTKTKPRDVPLSKVAVRLIKRMHGFDDVLVFGLQSQSLDTLFRRARVRAGLSGFTFHDARHTAATRMGLIPGMEALTLCKIFGWSRMDQALTYFNPSVSSIARRL